jgi:3-keto-L-gulonate-6-phosphate decarboxylase
VADTIGVKDQAARARQCAEWGVDMIYLHFGADQRRANPTQDGVSWIASVLEVVGNIPIGAGTFGVDDAVRSVRAGASLVAIGHPIFNAPDYFGALADFVQKVKEAK